MSAREFFMQQSADAAVVVDVLLRAHISPQGSRDRTMLPKMGPLPFRHNHNLNESYVRTADVLFAASERRTLYV